MIQLWKSTLNIGALQRPHLIGCDGKKYLKGVPAGCWAVCIFNFFLISFDNKSGLQFSIIFSVDPRGGSTLGEAAFVCTYVRTFVRPSPLTSFVYNSGSGWDFFLKSFGGIPGMLVIYFWIIPNFLYVSQTVSWLTSVLKLEKYRDTSSSGWNIFLIFCVTFLGC